MKPFSCAGVLYSLFEFINSNVSVYLITFLEYSGSSRFTIEPNLGPIIVGSLRLVAAGKNIVCRYDLVFMRLFIDKMALQV